MHLLSSISDTDMASAQAQHRRSQQMRWCHWRGQFSTPPQACQSSSYFNRICSNLSTSHAHHLHRVGALMSTPVPKSWIPVISTARIDDIRSTPSAKGSFLLSVAPCVVWPARRILPRSLLLSPPCPHARSAGHELDPDTFPTHEPLRATQSHSLPCLSLVSRLISAPTHSRCSRISRCIQPCRSRTRVAGARVHHKSLI